MLGRKEMVEVQVGGGGPTIQHVGGGWGWILVLFFTEVTAGKKKENSHPGVFVSSSETEILLTGENVDEKTICKHTTKKPLLDGDFRGLEWAGGSLKCLRERLRRSAIMYFLIEAGKSEGGLFGGGVEKS